ncbi:MAG: hypothetical protein ABII25_09125 [bacterium]
MIFMPQKGQEGLSLAIKIRDLDKNESQSNLKDIFIGGQQAKIRVLPNAIVYIKSNKNLFVLMIDDLGISTSIDQERFNIFLNTFKFVK